MVATGSSTTSSPTSTSSSTSDRPGLGTRAGGLARLGHPFPSLLDGVVVAAFALVAGAEAWTAVRLGGSMVALQLSIGALNDVVDAPRDEGHKPGKPIPAGLVGRRTAKAYAVLAAAVGLVFAAASGWAQATLALVVLAVGATYDLRAKGTAWSWVPFAIGIPILPVYGWWGAAGALPGWFAALLPAAILAGAGLAIANARADAERDAAVGITSLATVLGLARSWWLGAALLAAALAILAVGSAITVPGGVPLVSGLGLMLGAGLAAAGLAAGRSQLPERRERAWQAQAVGVAVIGVGWIVGVTTGPG